MFDRRTEEPKRRESRNEGPTLLYEGVIIPVQTSLPLSCARALRFFHHPPSHNPDFPTANDADPCGRRVPGVTYLTALIRR
jgi:hypothetical protein